MVASVRDVVHITARVQSFRFTRRRSSVEKVVVNVGKLAATWSERLRASQCGGPVFASARRPSEATPWLSASHQDRIPGGDPLAQSVPGEQLVGSGDSFGCVTEALRNHVHLQGLNEIQAYILVNRWSLDHSNSVPEVSQEFLEQLQHTYLLQRSFLLRSIQHLLLELDMSEESHQSLTGNAITAALQSGLDASLCEFLAISLDPDCHPSLALKGGGLAFAPDDLTAAGTSNCDARGQSWLCQQQALMEQEVVIELAISVFEHRVCSTTCFPKVMNAIHLHIFSSWHEAIAAGGIRARVAHLVSDRSVPFCLFLQHELIAV